MPHSLIGRYIPPGYSLIAQDERFGFQVYGTESPSIVALAFGGKRTKPDWHYRFASLDRLHAKIEETLRGYMDDAERKAKYKAQRQAPHDVKVGDIFRSSWGYEQTNIDYYQVTRLVGSRSIEVRAIAADSIDTHYMQGDCVPMRDAFIGEPMTKRISMAGGEPAFAVASYANAYRMKPVAHVAGVPVYGASHWTAYA